MGGALIKGWVKAGMVSDLTITAHTQQTLERFTETCPSITTMLDNSKAVQGADVVVLAVKPWLVELFTMVKGVFSTMGTFCESA